MCSSSYLSLENASNGVLDERADVYSFGILVMEIICGRIPVDHNQPQVKTHGINQVLYSQYPKTEHQLQVYLIEWLKSMVANQKIMYVADPKLAEMPSSKDLKRILLLALRCTDLNTKHRPTMGDVIHMLEPRDLLLYDVRRNFYKDI